LPFRLGGFLVTSLPPANTLRLQSYRTLEDLHSLLPAWERLLTEYPKATTFSTWEWLSSWWRSFGNAQQLLVLGGFKDSELIGLAPFSLARQNFSPGISLRILKLMGDGSGDSDNLDLPVKPGNEEIFARSVVDYLMSERRSWDVCQLNTLPPDSALASLLSEEAARRGCLTFEYRRTASAITLPATWEEYLAQLSSEDQKNLVRYDRRLAKRYRVRIYRCTEADDLPRVLEAMFKLHQARWEDEGESGSFKDPARRNFYYHLSRALLTRGRLELWVLELDDNVASAQYAFRHGDAVFQLQEGNDPARSSDRVGFILRGHVIRHLIGEGVRVYDFLGGAPGYKARWGAKETYYQNIHFARRFSVGGAVLWSTHSWSQLKHSLRRRLPVRAWSVLHQLNLAMRNQKSKRRPENL